MKPVIKRLPARPDLAHLKKQAKQLLNDWREARPEALERLQALRVVAEPVSGVDRAAQPVEAAPRLSLAQLCLAREYGCSSWSELSAWVAVRRQRSEDPARRLQHWLALVYPGDVVGSLDRARPRLTAQMLEEEGASMLGEDPWLACAVGDLEILRRASSRDPAWVHRPGGPLALPPLLAVTHSSLVRLPAFAAGLRDSLRWLLAAGADPNQTAGSRWPPASVAAPSNEHALTALYGAAGQHGDAVLTRLLLDAGADPDDGESLYHALEHPDCLQPLLEAGARVAGTGAIYRVLDRDDLPTLRLLLAHGADPNEAPPQGPALAWPSPLLWAIRRGRSLAHVETLLDAGADPAVRTAEGLDAASLALQYGLPALVERLAGGAQPAQSRLSARFVAACACGDEPAARALLSMQPGLVAALSAAELRLLPEMAALGRHEAVRCMVRLGWPIATPGGDWSASAFNQAVFRGDAEMARFLLAHGADWREVHGFGSDALGTLSWASCNEPDGIGPGPDAGDWPGCAAAMREHGMPAARPDPQDPDALLIDGRSLEFSDEVCEILLRLP